jgi:hypothetical protein
MIYCKTENLRFFLRKIGESKEELEDTKEVIRICISKKNRHHKGQKKLEAQV